MTSMRKLRNRFNALTSVQVNMEADLKAARRLESAFTKKAALEKLKVKIFGTIAASAVAFAAVGLTSQPVGRHSNVGQVAALGIAAVATGFAMTAMDKRDEAAACAEVLRDKIGDYHEGRYNGKR